MAALATAFVRILGDTKGLQPGVVAGAQKAGVAAGGTASKGFRGAFLGGVKGLAGPLAAVFGVQQLFGFFKDVVGEASNLQESINAVNVTFGEAAKGVLKLSKNAATGVGLSRVEFNALAVRFSAFAKTIVGEGGNVTGAIRDITQRAADFASVMNLDVAEAAELFQSGLAGETEPLRKFGIDLSAAAVQAHAYEEGIAAAGEELTEQQKVQARYSLLLKQTNKVQGDFANTSDSLANQQRILGARFDNLKATLGRALLPIITKVVTFFNNLVMSFSSGKSAISGVGSAFSGILDFVRPLIPILRDLWNQIIAIAIPALREIWQQLRTSVIPAFQAFLTAVRPILAWLIETIGGVLVEVFRGIVNVIKGALKVITGIFQVFAGVFTGDWSKAWNGVKTIFSGVWQIIKTIFQTVFNAIKGLLRRGLDVIDGLWTSAWNAVKDFVSGAWNTIRDTVARGINRMTGAVGTGVDEVRGFFARLPGRIVSALGNLGGLLIDAGQDIIQGLIDGMQSMAAVARAAAEAIADSVVGGLGGVLKLGSPSKVMFEIGMNTSLGFIQGLRRGAADLDRAVSGMASTTIGSAARSGGSPFGMPRELVLRDFDGSLIGRMRVEAERTATMHDRTFADRLAKGGAF